MSVRLTCLTTVVALLALSHPAAAHTSSFTYAALEIGGDRRALTYELKIRTTDLYEALGGTSGDDPDDATLRAGETALYAYVAARVDLSVPGQRCAAAVEPLAIVHQGERFVRLGFRRHCALPIDRVELDYDLFYDLDANHIGLVRVGGDTVQLRAPDNNHLSWEVTGHAESGLGGFVRSGVLHILAGLDHILFLVSLLLVAVVRRSAGGALERRPLLAALRYTAGIATAFTVAHSITLIAAGLGWIDLPRRLVECTIAASIAYVAIENAVRPDPPRRYLVTFGFGLIHGLGFAAMLAPSLQGGAVLLPLLAFNVGVELGQLIVVLPILPILYLVAGRLGPASYRRIVLGGGAVVLGGLAVVWLIERALDVVILGLGA